MALSGKATDRLCWWVVYVGVGLVVLWSGTQLINYALEVRFYKDYLLKWAVLIEKHDSEDAAWPMFTEDDPSAYMHRLAEVSRARGTALPSSNTPDSFVYRLSRLGRETETVFLLGLPGRIVLNGISERTFARLDKWIDGTADGRSGSFVLLSKGEGETTCTGELRM